MKQHAHDFATSSLQLRYLLYQPAPSSQRHPLILFLHGAGERGSDLKMMIQQGIPKIVEEQADFPFITVSPQCPLGTWWSFELATINALLDSVIANYPVDPDRVYMTGMGMGGYGTWNYATEYPDRLAAIAPIAGGGDPDKVERIKQMGVWAFHGALDNVVLPRESRKMVEALREVGGNVRFTVYANAGHDCWTATYNNPKLYEWLLQHKRP